MYVVQSTVDRSLFFLSLSSFFWYLSFCAIQLTISGGYLKRFAPKSSLRTTKHDERRKQGAKEKGTSTQREGGEKPVVTENKISLNWTIDNSYKSMSLLVSNRRLNITLSNALRCVKGSNGVLSVLHVREMSSNADNTLPVSSFILSSPSLTYAT
jgi:hypothetical protein